MKSLDYKAWVALLVIATSVLFTSCKKEQTTLAKVKVVNELNEVQENAMVRVWPNPNPVLNQMVTDDTSFTNDEGMCYFDYTDAFNLGTAGFRILDIEVETEDGLFRGEGIIKIVEEETSEVTIVVSQI